MKYPNLRAYMAAIADIKNINIPFFQSSSMQIYLNRRGVPYMSVGGFGAVFRFKDKQGRQYGLKCFTREVDGRAARYRALHDTLQITKFHFMVDFQYVEDGLKVGNNVFPVVVMEWGTGVGLDTAIENDMEDNGSLTSAPRLAGNLYKVVKTLQEWNMGHNDLQEGNLLVDDTGNITLIDYDGMFVPALEGMEASEMGLADYQHPRRDEKDFTSRIDDFSLLAILLQLAVITPENWKEHHDDKRLLLRQADYKKPGSSKLLKSIGRNKAPHVRALSKIFKKALKSPPLKIDAIAAIESEPDIMNWFQYTEDTGIDANYTSIISRVVSLTGDEVDAYADTPPEDAAPETQGLPTQPAPSSMEDVSGAEEGDWGTVSGIQKGIIDLFFEEVQEATRTVAAARKQKESGSGLDRIKRGVMDLLFEEIPEEDPPATAANDDEDETRTVGFATAVRNVQRGRGPGVRVHVGKGSPPPEQAPESRDPETTEAPVPDWMKRRRRK